MSRALSVLLGPLQLSAATLQRGFNGIKVPAEIWTLDANTCCDEVNAGAKNISSTETTESISCHAEVARHLAGGMSKSHLLKRENRCALERLELTLSPKCCHLGH
ncbi:hypothetical protein IQ216_06410 [Cyanobium sp. LEGE 06143]|nr:hypothetical protein [Cyanobium sp. LEGE 06143]